MATYLNHTEDAANGRKAVAGSSQADETFLSDRDYNAIYGEGGLSDQWFAANAAGDTALANSLHAQAEALRNNAGYSGGDDGSRYIRLDDGEESARYGGGSGGGAPVQPSTGYGSNVDAQRALLEQWKAQAAQQANAKIDYGVSTSTKELERALMNAQPQFQEQAESVARDERQGLDNSALYARLRGDQGGVSQSQYNEIQAQASKNRLAVQQAQTKLSTDTARQIEDLRAQGEFAKADAALQVSQQYLQQLMGLEQWAAEYNLSAAQFEASLQQWEYQYQLSMAQLNQNQAQFNAQLGYNYASLGQSQSQYQQKQLSAMGQALLSAGIMPSGEQLSAMGMGQEQAAAYLQAAQLRAASKGGGGGSGSKKASLSYEEINPTLASAGINSEAKAKSYLINLGLSSTEASTYAKSYAEWYGTASKNASSYQTLRSQIRNISPGTEVNVAAAFHERIMASLAAGTITVSQANELLSMLGIE